jgi:hypothetical protein
MLFYNSGSCGKALDKCTVTYSYGYVAFAIKSIALDYLGLYGQANKRIRWMPWRQQAMKDVAACDKPRGAGKRALIRGCPNGETHLPSAGICI